MNPFVGARGTSQLGSDRQPSQKGTRRSQPYRRKKRHHHGRPQGATLTAMLKGSPAFLPNPMDAKRQMQKQLHRGR